MPESLLTFIRASAAQRYRSTFDKTLRQGHGERRVMAVQAHAAAKAALTPRQAAIVEMTTLRGHDLATVAAKAGSTVEALDALLAEACDALHAHYRAKDEAERARLEEAAQ